MNKPDQSSPAPSDPIADLNTDKKLDRKTEKPIKPRREWLPEEDDDDWYEPDYAQSDRRS